MAPRIRFGVQYMRTTSGDDWRGKAKKAEGVGYSTMLIPDHFMWDVSVFPALQAAADATSTLHVGSMVLCNDFRHPLVTARDAASLQFLSGGRYELGIGAGWAAEEYEQAGIPFDPPGVRIDRFEEGLAVIRHAFSGQPFDFQGKYYRTKNYTGNPVPSPPPPLVIGGGGRRMLGIAGRNADVVSVTFDLRKGMGSATERFDDAQLEKKIGWVRAAAGERFAQIELCLMVFWAGVTDDALKAVAPGAESMGCTPEEALRMPSFVFGTEDEVAARLRDLRDRFGISYFVFSEFASDLTSLEGVVRRLAGT